MPPATGQSPNGQSAAADAAYPSRTIAFQAAGMITQIVEALQQHDELRCTPAFMFALLGGTDEPHMLTLATACTVSSLR